MGVGKSDKPLDEDARPIVAGEVWRKLIFKCTFAADKKHGMEQLEQMGMERMGFSKPSGILRTLQLC